MEVRDKLSELMNFDANSWVFRKWLEINKDDESWECNNKDIDNNGLSKNLASDILFSRVAGTLRMEGIMCEVLGEETADKWLNDNYSLPDYNSKFDGLLRLKRCAYCGVCTVDEVESVYSGGVLCRGCAEFYDTIGRDAGLDPWMTCNVGREQMKINEIERRRKEIEDDDKRIDEKIKATSKWCRTTKPKAKVKTPQEIDDDNEKHVHDYDVWRDLQNDERNITW